MNAGDGNTPAVRTLANIAGMAAAILAVGAAAATPRAPCGTAKAPARWQHVIWVWMENESFSSIVGSPSAPYITKLARSCGLAGNYHAVAHPSLPNYLAATSGETWGIADDAPPAAHPIAHPSIFSQLSEAGMSWRSYEEGMPWNCDLSSSGAYAVKHDPAAYYVGIRNDCRRHDVPMTMLGPELRGNRLPAFALVIPNLCNDMHDCPVQTGDEWLRHWLPRIFESPSYRARTTVLILTFDEGTDSTNHVSAILVSPATPPVTRAMQRFDHYSLLKTTEQLLGLPTILGRARRARSMLTPFHL